MIRISQANGFLRTLTQMCQVIKLLGLKKKSRLSRFQQGSYKNLILTRFQQGSYRNLILTRFQQGTHKNSILIRFQQGSCKEINFD